MQRKEFEIRAFDLGKTQSEILSVRVSSDGLYFMVLDPAKQRPLYMQRIVDASRGGIEVLAEEVRRDKALQSNFLRTIIIYESPRYTLLPSLIAKDANKEEVMRTVFGEEGIKDNDVTECELRSEGITTYFLIPKEDRVRMQTYLPNAEIIHHSVPLLFFATLNAKSGKSQSLHLNICSSYFDAIYIEDGVLKMMNSYEYATADEMLYFMLSIFETFHIDQYACRVRISGDVDDNAPTVQAVRKYSARVEYANPPKGISLKGAFDNIKDKHQYLTLFQTPLCV